MLKINMQSESHVPAAAHEAHPDQTVALRHLRRSVLRKGDKKVEGEVLNSIPMEHPQSTTRDGSVSSDSSSEVKTPDASAESAKLEDTHESTTLGSAAVGLPLGGATYMLTAAALTSMSSSTAVMHGVVVDGYIKGAHVSRANGTGNRVVTDDLGRFEGLGGFGEIVVRGGVDMATGLPFMGEMRTHERGGVVTPLTTLVQALIRDGESPDQAVTLIMQAFGLDPSFDLMKTDPLAAIAAGDVNALLVVNVGMQIATLLQSIAGSTDATSIATTELARHIMDLPRNGLLDLADVNLLTDIRAATKDIGNSNVNIVELSQSIQRMHEFPVNLENLGALITIQREAIILQLSEVLPPILTVQDNVAGITNGPVAFIFTFTKPVIGFGEKNILTTGGIGVLEGSGSAYTLTVTPDSNSESPIIISVESVGVTDEFGNALLPFGSYIQPVDTLAPPPLKLTLPLEDSNSDGLTNKTDIGIIGIELNSTWEYSTNGGITWIAGNGSTFPLIEGTYAVGSVRVRQTDAAGNVGIENQNESSIIVDITAPAAPTLLLASDVGDIVTDGITKVGTVNVNGLEAGGRWEYSTNSGTSWMAGSGSNFTLSPGSYAAGVVRVRQTDAAGNLGAVGLNAGSFTIDTTAPTVNSVVITASGGHGTMLIADDQVTVTTIYSEVVSGQPTAAPTLVIGSEYGIAMTAGVTTGNTRTWTYTISSIGTTDMGSISVVGDMVAGITDTAGNAAVGTPPPVVGSLMADTTPPTAPTLALATDSGSSSSDGLTSIGTVNISGLESGASWEFSTNGGTDWTTGSGTSFVLPEGRFIPRDVQVRQIDFAGRRSIVSAFPDAQSIFTKKARLAAELGLITDETPSISALTTGGFVIAWNGSVFDTIHVQRFDNEGAKVGAKHEIRGVRSGISPYTQPAVTSLADGGYVVVGRTQETSYLDTGIVLQRFGTTGEKVGNQQILRSMSGVVADRHPTVVALSDGGFVIGWTSETNDGQSTDVFVQRFDSSGEKLGQQERLQGRAGNTSDTDVSITALSAGGYVATWASHAVNDQHLDIAIQRFDNMGSRLGGIEILRGMPGNLADQTPKVVALPNGGYWVVWRGVTSDAQGDDIFSQRFNSEGVRVGDPIRLQGALGDLTDQFPVISVLSDGGVAIAWHGVTSDGQATDIFIQKYDDTGLAVGTQQRLQGMPGNLPDQQPRITALPDGGYIVAWTGYTSDSQNDDIFFQRFNSDGSRANNVERLQGMIGVLNDQTPVITTLANGAYTIAWRGATSDGLGDDIFIHLVSPPSLRVDTTPPSTPILTLASGITGTGASRNEAISANGVLTLQAESGTNVTVTFTGHSGDRVVKTVNDIGSVPHAITLTQNDLATLRDGQILVNAVATDSAGNASGVAAGNFYLDATSPLLSPDSSPAVFFRSTNAMQNTLGDSVVLNVSFNEPVYGLTSGLNSSIFKIGTTGMTAVWGGNDGGSTRTLTYEIRAGQSGQLTLDENALKFTLFGGISDLAGNMFFHNGSIANIDVSPLPVINTPAAVLSLSDWSGQLMHPVFVDGNVYYIWDVSGDGAITDQDRVSTESLAQFFFNNTGSTFTESTRFASVNGVNIALPTDGNTSAVNHWQVLGPAGEYYYPAGSEVDNGSAGIYYAVGTEVFGQGVASNTAYDDLLAVWDAFNGSGVEASQNISGVPTGWVQGSYATATPSATGHSVVNLTDGSVLDSSDLESVYVVFQVL